MFVVELYKDYEMMEFYDEHINIIHEDALRGGNHLDIRLDTKFFEGFVLGIIVEVEGDKFYRVVNLTIPIIASLIKFSFDTNINQIITEKIIISAVTNTYKIYRTEPIDKDLEDIISFLVSIERYEMCAFIKNNYLDK